MRVLEINAAYGHGSTGTIVRDIEQLCLSEGIDCYVASPDPAVKTADNGYVIGNTFDHKLHALLCRINGKQAYFSRIATRRLLKHIDAIKPDIVHLHNLHSNYIHLNMLLDYLAKRDIRTIITFHDCWFFTGGCFHYASTGCTKWQQECGNCPRKKQDTPSYFKDCTAQILKDRKKYLTAIPRLTIIGASQWVADECRKSILKDCDIRYIHNGFDLNIFKPTPSDLRKQLNLEGKYVILGPSSKWNQEINKPTYDYFVKNMTDDMELVLFGGDSSRQTPANVKEIGYIRNPHNMAALYSMVDVFVNCSREDTLPGVNLESQACGTPVITYDATGCKETVNQICGLSVETNNHKALFDAMLQIKATDKQELSQKCISRINNEFEKHNSYLNYINLFKEC